MPVYDILPWNAASEEGAIKADPGMARISSLDNRVPQKNAFLLSFDPDRKIKLF